MRIAYCCSYIGTQFLSKYCTGKKFAVSGILKSQGIARSLMSAGHEVVIYSPGLTICKRVIDPFIENVEFKEGTVTVKYPKVISFPKCSMLNWISIKHFIKQDIAVEKYDVVIFYNITEGAALLMKTFKSSIKILEYEDNIFNKNLVGDKSSNTFFKKLLYNSVVPKIDGAFVVCNGMYNSLKNNIRLALTPGILNEEVIESISQRKHSINREGPVNLFLTGGTHYSKGFDLLIDALNYVSTPCVLHVYGNGEADKNAIEAITSIPKIHHVHLNGYMPHSELIKTIDQKADILINVTRSMGVGAQSAGFPFKMMEYAATGRPIVSSELGKLDDDFNSCVTYYLGDDPIAIAYAIEEVIRDYSHKVDLALKLQNRVIKEYSISGVGTTVNNLINELKGQN